MMKQGSIKDIARQRVEILFAQAKSVAKANPKLAAQYIASARRIAMAAKIGYA
jgi:RNase P subunit RPR2